MEMTVWYSEQALRVINSLPIDDREAIVEHIRGYGQPVHVPGGEIVQSNIGRFGIASISELDQHGRHFKVYVHAILVGQPTIGE